MGQGRVKFSFKNLHIKSSAPSIQKYSAAYVIKVKKGQGRVKISRFFIYYVLDMLDITTTMNLWGREGSKFSYVFIQKLPYKNLVHHPYKIYSAAYVIKVTK